MTTTTMDSIFKLSLEERKAKADEIMSIEPERVPVLVTCKQGKITLNKNQFMVPKKLKVVHFTATLRRSINLSPESALYLYSGGQMIKQDKFIGEIYDSCKSEDGFLYFNISDIPSLGQNS